MKLPSLHLVPTTTNRFKECYSCISEQGVYSLLWESIRLVVSTTGSILLYWIESLFILLFNNNCTNESTLLIWSLLNSLLRLHHLPAQAIITTIIIYMYMYSATDVPLKTLQTIGLSTNVKSKVSLSIKYIVNYREEGNSKIL